jgi:hypothetical protein
VVEHQNRPLAEKLENLVDGIAELEAAVLDAEDSLVGCREAAVEEKNVSHRGE